MGQLLSAAPPPQCRLRLEVALKGIGREETRSNFSCGRPAVESVYVTARCGGAWRQTQSARGLEGGSVDFAGQSLILDKVAVPRAGVACRVDFRVALERSHRPDRTFGCATLSLSADELEDVDEARQLEERTLDVSHRFRRFRRRGELTVRITVLPPGCDSLLAAPGDQPLPALVRGLADTLGGPDGPALAEGALREALGPQARALTSEEQASLAQIFGLLRPLRLGVSDDMTASEVLDRSGYLSFSLQRFVEDYLSPEDTALARLLRPTSERAREVTGAWIRQFFVRQGASTVREDRLAALLAAADATPALGELQLLAAGGAVAVWGRWGEVVPFSFTPLGRGNQGDVYLADRRLRNGRFAMKLVRHKHGERQPVDTREQELGRYLLVAPHPCCVRLRGVFSWDGDSPMDALVMELCDGDLHQVICDAWDRDDAQGQYRPPQMAPRWSCQIFLGLEYLHKKLRMAVRDLKPANVLMKRGRALLADFGHGRLGMECNGNFTLHAAPPGTPGFVAPEVVLGLGYTWKADLYCFGVLNWVLFSGGRKERGKHGLPPCAPRMGAANPYLALARNGDLLREHIERPHRAVANPLPSENVKELVLSLIKYNPEERPAHAGVRSLEFMRAAGLPEAEPLRDVEAWCHAGAPAAAAPAVAAAGAPCAAEDCPRPLEPALATEAPLAFAAQLAEDAAAGQGCGMAAAGSDTSERGTTTTAATTLGETAAAADPVDGQAPPSDPGTCLGSGLKV